jgi:hypothetical protein
VLDVSLDGLDQIRDQVIAPRELHVDLGESVLVTVSRADQAVVQRDDKPDGDDGDGKQYPTHDGTP